MVYFLYINWLMNVLLFYLLHLLNELLRLLPLQIYLLLGLYSLFRMLIFLFLTLSPLMNFICKHFCSDNLRVIHLYRFFLFSSLVNQLIGWSILLNSWFFVGSSVTPAIYFSLCFSFVSSRKIKRASIAQLVFLNLL
jgi:hypothetical protein